MGVRCPVNGTPCDFVNHFTLFATRKTHFLSSSIPVLSPDCFLTNSPPPPLFPLFLFLLSPSVCLFPFPPSPLLLNTCVQRHQVCYICSGYDHISSTCPSLFCTYCFQKNHRGQVGRERGRGKKGEGERREKEGGRVEGEREKGEGRKGREKEEGRKGREKGEGRRGIEKGEGSREGGLQNCKNCGINDADQIEGAEFHIWSEGNFYTYIPKLWVPLRTHAFIGGHSLHPASPFLVCSKTSGIHNYSLFTTVVYISCFLWDFFFSCHSLRMWIWNENME